MEETSPVLADDHIIEIEDNFWDIGVGPSGPDSRNFYESWRKNLIHYQKMIWKLSGRWKWRWLEYGTLVFLNLIIKKTGPYETLPNKNIDTGMDLKSSLNFYKMLLQIFENRFFMPIIRDKR